MKVDIFNQGHNIMGIFDVLKWNEVKRSLIISNKLYIYKLSH